ncbi:MAG: hypothetical protein GQ477_03545 [Nanohaloarchaea archaeon]|nr:hypothetical protein [Candidatus Nanohaloarchaea archaeon]
MGPISLKQVLLEKYLPGIDDTIPFEYLEGAKVIDLSGNILKIHKDEKEQILYFGATHDTFYLTPTKIETATEYYEAIRDREFKPVENFPELMGETIAEVNVRYASGEDEIMETPELVTIATDNVVHLKIPAVGHMITIYQNACHKLL